MNWDVIVIGGGAAGLMAAGRAAELGARVLLLEKMGRVGLKLGLTGKGRCNITNSGDLPEFIESYRRNGKFLYNALARFGNEHLIDFFRARGLPTVEERGGRIFPVSNRAADVVRILRQFALAKSTRLMIHTPALQVLTRGGQAAGVRAEGGEFASRRIIVATGGASYPQTGSAGDGCRLAREVGHTIQPLRPALVPLETAESFVRDLAGLSLKNVKAVLYAGGRRGEEEFGEMLFTHFGVSGPVILTLSGSAVEEMARGRVEMAIDFKPALSPEKLDLRLLREFQSQGRKQVLKILPHLLPRRLVPVFAQTAGISPALKGSEVSSGERRRLAALLKDWRLALKGSRPLSEAIVTSGGVCVRELNPRTMESKIVKGLYFCGEVIDVDGRTGGYNLQAAFSTGWAAGEAAASAAD